MSKRPRISSGNGEVTKCDADIFSQFSLNGRVAVVTGGTGTLGKVMCAALAAAGARVAVLGRRVAAADAVVADIKGKGGDAMSVQADVLDEEQLRQARSKILDAWEGIDILVNCAGGNKKDATVGPDASFFDDMKLGACNDVMRLNFLGTVGPSQVFGKPMIAKRRGTIVNISSMAAQVPLTRVGGYSAAKAAVDSFTRWLSVELAQKYGAGLRVNALAPGFFLAEQNRALLTNADGSLTARGETIISQTPMGRFGNPDELVGALLFLCSDASKFVTGTVLSVDGGFSAFSGV
jgi:NAD(P)-dependent dehydrogenase (short-subunit alcohol dehydrogenase family)